MTMATYFRANFGTFGRMVGLGALYFLFGKLSFSMSVSHGIVTLVVFASEGIALAALILGGSKLWPGVFLGQFLLALSGGLPLGLALGISSINSLEAILGAMLFHRMGLRTGLDRMTDIAGLLLLIALVLQPFSAALGTFLLRIGGSLSAADHGRAFLSWWFGNLMGQFLFTPFLLVWSRSGLLTFKRLGPALAGGFGTLAASLFVFGIIGSGLHNASLVYAVLSPLLVGIAMVLGAPGATLSVLVVSGVAIAATHMGMGPFAALKGAETWIDLNVFLVGSCLTSLLVATLFAERKRSELRAQRLADANLIGVVIFKLGGRMSDANDAFLNLVGRTRQELAEGKLSWATLRSPEFESTRLAAVDALRIQGTSAPVEAEVLHASGRKIPVLVGATMFQDDSGEGVAFVLDLSVSKEQDRLKSEFVSLVSHELRTPLTSILGSLGLLRGRVLGELSEPIAEVVEIAHRNTELLVGVVNDILDLDKLSSGKMEFHLDPTDLVKVVQRALEDHRAYAEALGISLEFREKPEAAWAQVDVQRTLQILGNLLSNASKFSPPGETVTVDLHVGSQRIQLDVTNKGPGIPEAFQPRIFEPFTQADTSDAGKPKGTGLGLSIAKSMVERMGGQIGFVSVPGRGTTFTIEWPRLRIQPPSLS